MPEIGDAGDDLARLRKIGNDSESFRSRFFLNLAETSPASPASPADVPELTIILARGFLRLTQKGPNSDVSEHRRAAE